MAASSKSVSPAVVVGALVLVILVIAGLWWKTMGPGSAPGSQALNPNTPPGGAMPGPGGAGMPGPGGMSSGPPGGQMPGR